MSTKPNGGRISKKALVRKEAIKQTKSLIKQTVNSMAETKKQTYAVTSYPYSLQPTTTSLVNNETQLTPHSSYMVIPQGDGQGQRSGNKIAVHKAMYKYVITPEPVGAVPESQAYPVMVKLFFLRYKVQPTETPPSNSVVGGSAIIFNSGNTSRGMRGQLFDLLDEVNTDAFTLLGTRTHKVGPAISDASGNLGVFQNFANNDYKLNIIGKIDITKWFPKHFIFNDTDNTANNSGLTVLYQWIQAGGQIANVAKQPIRVDGMIDLYYKDF